MRRCTVEVAYDKLFMVQYKKLDFYGQLIGIYM